ncbi:MAG: DUF1428 domain-containing protein [Nitrosospira sp.]|nr:DUF1428 domain-containing protein [Nitrosospira sp.]
MPAPPAGRRKIGTTPCPDQPASAGFLLPATSVSNSPRSFAVFREYSALNVVECWGDDVPEGKLTSFPMAVKCQADETVVFSWVTWPSRQVRDEAWKKVMADPRLQPDANPMPFDGKRLIYGGFEAIVET